MGAKENSVKKQCLLWLAERKIPAWENNTGSVPTSDGRFIRFGYKGSSDIFAILPGGRLWCIECKTDDGRQRKSQKIFQKMVQKADAVYTIARSERDLESVLPAIATDFKDVRWWHYAICKIAAIMEIKT